MVARYVCSSMMFFNLCSGREEPGADDQQLDVPAVAGRQPGVEPDQPLIHTQRAPPNQLGAYFNQ